MGYDFDTLTVFYTSQVIKRAAESDRRISRIDRHQREADRDHRRSKKFKERVYGGRPPPAF